MARKLERAEWRPFLDRVSKVLAGKQAEIKVASLNLGDQLQAGWVSLIGLVYDCAPSGPTGQIELIA